MCVSSLLEGFVDLFSPLKSRIGTTLPSTVVLYASLPFTVVLYVSLPFTVVLYVSLPFTGGLCRFFLSPEYLRTSLH